MIRQKKFYLFHIQFLGFRYHGWLYQKGLKTVQSQIDKTFEFIFGHSNFKTLGCSRTDAKVSANHFAFELFTETNLEPESFLNHFNQNLPNDIRVLKIEEVDENFNIIKAPKTKEYLYLFAHGQKNHPFCAAQLMSIDEKLDIEKMISGAKLFEGEHDFRRYCAKPNPNANFIRKVDLSEIVVNKEYHSDFFPETSYFFKVRSQGFMRYQVRLMMGTLISLGKNEISLNDLKASLSGSSIVPMRNIAPSSGLILNKIEFD